MLELLFKIAIAFAIGGFFGYLFKIFSRPRSLEPARNRPDSKFEDIDGFKVFYQQKGHGPDLLLIHGLGASTFCWRHVWHDLAKTYRVTALDLPGFGQTSKDPNAVYDLDKQTERLNMFLNRLGIRRTSIMGCSMGAAIGLWLGVIQPEKVEKVVVIAPAVNSRLVFLNHKKWTWLMKGVRGFVVTPFLVRQIARRVHTRYNELTDHDFKRMYQPFHRNPDAVTAFWKSQELLSDRRLPEGLSALRQPVLIMYGEGDRIVPAKYVDNLAEVIPNSKIVKHPTGGHHLMEDEPSFVVEEVKKFLTEKRLSLV